PPTVRRLVALRRAAFDGPPPGGKPQKNGFKTPPLKGGNPGVFFMGEAFPPLVPRGAGPPVSSSGGCSPSPPPPRVLLFGSGGVFHAREGAGSRGGSVGWGWGGPSPRLPAPPSGPE